MPAKAGSVQKKNEPLSGNYHMLDEPQMNTNTLFSGLVWVPLLITISCLNLLSKILYVLRNKSFHHMSD